MRDTELHVPKCCSMPSRTTVRVHAIHLTVLWNIYLKPHCGLFFAISITFFDIPDVKAGNH